MTANIIFDIVILIAIGLVYYLLRNSLSSYFSEKGKNLATKQDVGEITEEIESVKKIHQKELEELKASLAKEKAITNLALQARNISLSIFSEQKGEAIQNMWDQMVEFRKKSAFELTQADFFLNSSKYEKEVFNPNIRNSTEAKALNLKKVYSETSSAFEALRKDKVWLGQSLWDKYNSYISIISIIRVKFIRYLENEEDLDFSNQENLRELLTEFYSEEIINEYKFLKNISSISVVLNGIERQILNEINDIQSGKKATRETLDHAAKIENIKRKFV